MHKEREQGRVVKVEQRIVLGTPEQVVAALEEGSTAKSIKMSYVERWNGTQRHFNARKARKVYTFSKEFIFHVAVTWLCVVSYNFCWTHESLRLRAIGGRQWQERTPAMAAGLTDHTSGPWTNCCATKCRQLSGLPHRHPSGAAARPTPHL